MASRRRRASGEETETKTEALPEASMDTTFPSIELPVRPPYAPMEALATEELPSGDGWLYEPKWDGFRCLAFRRGDEVLLQSKSGQTLGRYFPELIEAVRALPGERLVLDGEIVIFTEGALDFDALLQRIHPADSRIRRLASETPTTYLAFDLLVDARGEPLVELPPSARRCPLTAASGFLPPPATAPSRSGG
jgi:ATP-dependent DNA ligase